MTIRHYLLLTVALTAAVPTLSNAAEKNAAPDYTKQIAPIFRTYCSGCHNRKDAEGELTLDTFAGLKKGGENGAIVVAGKPEKSRLLLSVERKVEPFMPPEGEKAPSKAEIALLRAWIKAGARGPVGGDDPLTLVTPKIAPLGKVRRAVHAVSYSPNGKLLAIGRYGSVDVIDAVKRTPVATLKNISGHVTDVGFTRDGKTLFAAAGEPGLFGQAVLWRTSDWKPARTIRGHNDSLYAAAVSPNSKLLATGSYDRSIRLWDVATGKEVRELAGHNGAITDLAFHPAGAILASASSDRTIKLWNVATGERLDTLGQPEKDQYTVAFSPNGRFVVAGGVDHRIRVWEILSGGKEGTNPLRYARFAHEAPILKIAFSPDGTRLISSAEDRSVKLWKTADFTQAGAIERQPDWAPALAVSPNGKVLTIGRADGSLAGYGLSKVGGSPRAARPTFSPKPKLPTPKVAVLKAPGAVDGLLVQPGQADLYLFSSRADRTWIIETEASQKKSPVDTKIEILHPDGRPVLRSLLQAVRDSWITFRPINSTSADVRAKNWEEMGLNQYLYMAGEVCKIHRMPQGPDSGLRFYAIGGKRQLYLDSSATIHAVNDPVYIVEAHSPTASLADNGLPVFPLYYANDDDGQRKLGADSQLTFTAPADGEYLVRVSDVRGFGGKDFKYRLSVRDPKPDFSVAFDGKKPSIAAGSGKRIKFTLTRADGFDDDVAISIAGLPPGFSAASPVVVQAGHLEAQGVINAAADAKTPTKEQWKQIKITAQATVAGKNVVKPLGNFGEIKVTAKPKVIVHLVPDPEAKIPAQINKTGEIVIVPGTMTTAIVRIERNGAKGDLRFDVDNLPHGVIVADLGLSGITVLAGRNERRIFLQADSWVPETNRLIHAVSRTEGNQSSRPIGFHVRRVQKVGTESRGGR
jgi:WD40 repeat protein/mono/diheme cytochrome c family protein